MDACHGWQKVLDFLRTRQIAGVETVGVNTYRRTAFAGSSPGWAEVTFDGTSASTKVSCSELQNEANLRFPRIFDLQADPRACSHLRKDRRLARSIAKGTTLRLPGCWDPFEIAVRAIIGQQISVAAARTILGRLVRLAGTPSGDGWTFPTAAQVLNAELTAIGLTKTRAETLLGMARAVDSGAVRLDPSQALDETVGQLTELKGIGDWTAHYIAMRGLGQGDAFPASDLILRRAASTASEPLSTKQMIENAERWRPFRAYAAIALWSSYAGKP